MSHQSKNGLNPVSILIGILVIGSFWGFVEAAFGGFIKQIGLPLRSPLMTGIGIGILAVAVGIYRRPIILPAIALIAILSKLLVVPILGLTLLCRANSQLALGIGGVTLAGVYQVFSPHLSKKPSIKIAIGAVAGFLTAILFVNIGMHLAPCKPLLAFNYPGGAVDFMLPKGLLWTASSALFFPLGYSLGEKIRDGVLSFESREPVVYYSAAAMIIAACWLLNAAAVTVGL